MGGAELPIDESEREGFASQVTPTLPLPNPLTLALPLHPNPTPTLSLPPTPTPTPYLTLTLQVTILRASRRSCTIRSTLSRSCATPPRASSPGGRGHPLHHRHGLIQPPERLRQGDGLPGRRRAVRVQRGAQQRLPRVPAGLRRAAAGQCNNTHIELMWNRWQRRRHQPNHHYTDYPILSTSGGYMLRCSGTRPTRSTTTRHQGSSQPLARRRVLLQAGALARDPNLNLTPTPTPHPNLTLTLTLTLT